jgi:hypothetical protein
MCGGDGDMVLEAPAKDRPAPDTFNIKFEVKQVLLRPLPQGLASGRLVAEKIIQACSVRKRRAASDGLPRKDKWVFAVFA